MVGELVFNDLQALPEAFTGVAISARRLAAGNLPRLAGRTPTAHKGKFGHVLLIGGDRGFGGAILLSAQSALRSGAGMVSVATAASMCRPHWREFPKRWCWALRRRIS